METAMIAPTVRFLIFVGLLLAGSISVRADEAQFATTIKASLVFRDDFDAARHYPHILKVYLRLDNVHDSDVSWVADAVAGTEAELLDAEGKAVPQGPSAASILSNRSAYLLPFGSRLDWLVSHGGISLMGDAKDHYALLVGGRGWLIPIEKAGAYSVRLRLKGLPWTRATEGAERQRDKLLLDLPPAKIEISK